VIAGDSRYVSLASIPSECLLSFEMFCRKYLFDN